MDSNFDRWIIRIIILLSVFTVFVILNTRRRVWDENMRHIIFDHSDDLFIN